MAQAQNTKSGLSPRPEPGAPVKQRRRRHLFTQLAGWFVLISLVPLFLAGYFNYRYAADGILSDKKDNLKALVLHQASEVTLYLEGARQMTSLLSGSPVVRDALSELGSISPADYANFANSPALRTVQADWGARFKNFVDQLEFSDVYLVNLQGLIVYSAGGQTPLYTSLKSSPGDQLAIASLFEQVVQKRTVANSGMTVKTPNHQPAFYYAAPVFSQDDNTQLIGVIVVSLSQAPLQRVLNNRIGLGATGEPIVFARDQGKFIIVNTPHFKSEAAFSVVTPISDSEKFGAGLTPVGEAIAAEGIGYRGHDILAAWTYLPSLDWVLMQKLDRSEVFEPVEALRRFSLILGAVTFILVIGVAALVARGITRPVVELTAVAERIAHGDLLTPVARDEHNEIGQLAQAVCTMSSSLKSLVRKVQDSSAIISTNAVQMAASSRQQAEVAQGTGAAAIEVAATARQISATSQELTRTMEEVNNVAQGTAQRAEAGLDGLQAIQATMGELDVARGTVADQLNLIAQKTEAICGITVTMTKVADQTNLLSLNAAIEARKAGEYGRGFSVVAREIQRLADQAGVATLEIEHTIAEMRQSVDAGVVGMKGFSAKTAAGVERIQTVTHQLTEVIQQVQGLPPRFEMVLQGMQSQSEGAQQITGAISHMSESAQQTATAVQEALRLLEQLRDTTRTLQAEVSLFKT